MKKAVIYTRVSTDKQNAERQINDLNKYASANGYEVIRTFNDVTSGTKKAADRKAASEMFEYLEREKVAIILMTEISRLGRSTIDVQNTLHKLVFKMGLNIYTSQTGMKARDAKGKLHPMFKIISDLTANLADLERQQISERTISKLNHKRKEYTAHNTAKGLKKGDKGFKQLGRPTGSNKAADKILIEYKKVVKKLNEGVSIRETAKICDVSPATVQKVKKAMIQAKTAGTKPVNDNKELAGQTKAF